MKTQALPVSFVMLLAAIPAYGQAADIEKFLGEIVVRPDGTLSVTETIRVYQGASDEKRSLCRDLPIANNDRLGDPVAIGYTIDEATHNGQRQAFHAEFFRNLLEVCMGEGWEPVPAGWHTYTLRYHTDRGVGFFKGHDELYWNLNESAWNFPISAVECSVRLPWRVAKSSLTIDSWTGETGTKENNCAHSVGDDGEIRLRSVGSLAVLKNVAFVVGWPKGLATEARWNQRALWFIRDHRGPAVATAGVLLVLLCYMIVWYLVGRDPKKGTIVPTYTPPDDVSPAAMRYVKNMDYDDRCFLSALMDMAVKKHIKIVKEGGRLAVYRLSEAGNGLSADEKRASDVLFRRREMITLDSLFHEDVTAAVTAVEKTLKQAHYEKSFVLNSFYTWAGALLSLLVVIIAGEEDPGSIIKGNIPVAIFLWLFLSVSVFGVRVLSRPAIRAWTTARGSGRVNSYSMAVVLALIPSLAVAGELWVYVQTHILPAAQTLITSLILFFMVLLFRHLLKAWTAAGRKLMDKLDGFRMFLCATEKERIRELFSRDVTPETIERLLPYALALDVEGVWAQQLAFALETTENADPGDYAPAWNGGMSIDLKGFASSFMAGLSGDYAASVRSPRRGSP